jgi:ABC-2 type transport system permease protein
VTALGALLRKELYHIRRDRRTLAVLVALPIVQVLLFGYAIRTDVNDVRLAIVDPAPSAATLSLRSRFASTGVFHLVAVVPREADLEPLFASGQAQQALVFDSNFARNLERHEPATLLILTDTTEPNTGSLLQAYAQSVVDGYQQELGPRVVHTTSAWSSRQATIAPSVRVRFNPTRASAYLFVPGLMAFVLTIISSLMTAISITREKETGTMEALLVSPLRPWEIIIGKVVPYLAIGFVGVVAVLIEAWVVFHVPIRGSVTLLLAEGGLYILASLSLGLLISARTDSQRVAMMAALLITMLPNILLSGFIFPLESMPAPLRVISFAIPGRWFVAIARGIMLKGIGLDYVWRETLALAAITAVLLAAAARSFNERLE